MDIFETLFEKLTQSKRHKSHKKSSTVFLKDINKYIHVVLQYHSPGLLQNQIHSGLKNCGYIDEDVYFPDLVDCFNATEKNLEIYKGLALATSLIKKYNLFSNLKSRSNTAHRLETLKYWHLLKSDQIIQVKTNSLSTFHSSIYNIWKKIYLESQDPFLFVDQIDQLIKKCKYNDEVPDFLFYTIPHLQIQTSAKGSYTKDLVATTAIYNEKQKERQDVQIHQDMNDQEEETNTIMHSFEKTETLDDYDGKKRFFDGDDDLDEHLQALDEVQMSQTVNQQQQTQSIFRSDMPITNKGEDPVIVDLENKLRFQKVFTYPEWHFKKHRYLEDYCKVYEKKVLPIDYQNQATIMFSEKYKNKVIRWQRQVQSLFNTPSWMKRQIDGHDLDIDECVRYISHIRHGDSDLQKIYQTKKKNLKDVSILILFDSSLSTDSYVKGVRIFDTIVESVSILSDVFNDLPMNIHIASTNSITHKHINYNIVKDFTENWTQVKKNINSLKPEGYTRLGPAIRHASIILKKEKSLSKFLILVTDGKPTDMDEYEGRRGIEDIKKALQLTESHGICSWAMTIENTDKIYFKNMFPNYSLTPTPDQFTDQLIQLLLKMSKQ